MLNGCLLKRKCACLSATYLCNKILLNLIKIKKKLKNNKNNIIKVLCTHIYAILVLIN